MRRYRPTPIEHKDKMSLGQLATAVRNMPVRHEGLSDELLAFAAYTYRHVGKYQCKSLEQWELGFMKDRNPDREIMFWMRVACVVQKLQGSKIMPIPSPSRPSLTPLCRWRSTACGIWKTSEGV